MPDAITETKASGTPAIVLLSGGLDSFTTLAIAKVEGFTVNALSYLGPILSMTYLKRRGLGKRQEASR